MFRYVILSTLLWASPLRAATFTVESAVSHAIKNNPDLAAARYTIEEARGRVIQSGRLSNPELESELKPNVRGRGEYSFSVGFTQRFPLTKRLWFERAISQAELRVAEAEVLNGGRLLSVDVRSAAIRLIALRRQKELKEIQRKNSTDLAAAAKGMAKQGLGSELDVTQLELEARQLSLELLQADGEIATITGTLRPLLGLKPTEPLSIIGDLQAPQPVKTGASPPQRADYRAALEKESAARTSIDLAKAGKWEDAGFGLSADIERAEDAPEGKETDGFIGFKFSLPLPFWNKNEGKVHEATAAANRASKERQALGLKIRSEAEAARAEMEAAARIVSESSGPGLSKALEFETSVRKAKDEAKATFTDVLRAREKRLAFEAAHMTALRDYHLARVRLMAAQGR